MWKKRFILLVVIIIFSLCACQKQEIAVESTRVESLQVDEAQVENTQMLHLTVTTQKDALIELENEEIRKIFNAGLRIQGVENVMISLDGEELSLEDAIRQGKVTPEFVRYACSQDVKNGYCIRQQDSWHGLDNVYFHYLEYSVLVVDDLLEGPKGTEYPVTYLAVYNHLGQMPMIDDFIDPETGFSVTREDWGLCFSADVEGGNLKLLCTQKDGMAVGTLKVTECLLLDESGNAVPLPYRDDTYLYMGEGFEIKPNADTEIIIPLKETLPKEGRYLCLMVNDHYDSNQLHPLIEKYHRSQSYQVELPKVENP